MAGDFTAAHPFHMWMLIQADGWSLQPREKRTALEGQGAAVAGKMRARFSRRWRPCRNLSASLEYQPCSIRMQYLGLVCAIDFKFLQ